MASTPIIKGLQIDEDMPFQRKDWVAQRIGWVLMGLIVLAALLGLTGRGAMSSAVAGEKQGALWVEYNRYARFQTPERVHLHWGPGAADGEGIVRVWVNNGLLEQNKLERITPEPKRMLTGSDRITLEFEQDSGSTEGSATLDLNVEQIGRCDVEIGIDHGPQVRFRQFVYP